MHLPNYHVHKSHELHMEEGPIGRTLLFFTVPILLSQILQQFYSIADCMIIGNFSGGNGLAAAGEGALILSVLINFFIGFSVGAGAVTGAAFGAHNYPKLKRAIQVVMQLSVLLGIILTIAGILSSQELLLLINCPDNILELSQEYLIISMLGIVPQFLYNMGNSILRSLGNTQDPLYYLVASLILNIVLDLLFVAYLGWGLPGAAVATVISQCGVAILILWKLTQLDDAYKFEIFQRPSRYFARELAEILRIGFPSGMQAIFMSASSMIIQYSINAFGAAAAAGMVVFARVEGFLYYPAFSYGMALTGFVSQNYGAGKLDRVHTSLKQSIVTVSLFIIAASALLCYASPFLLSLFTSEADIIQNGQQAILCILPFYFLYAINQIYMGALKGLGHTSFPMVCCMIAYCIFRVVWCEALLPHIPDIRVIYFSYDASWVLMIVLLFCYYHHTMKNLNE